LQSGWGDSGLLARKRLGDLSSPVVGKTVLLRVMPIATQAKLSKVEQVFPRYTGKGPCGEGREESVDGHVVFVVDPLLETAATSIALVDARALHFSVKTTASDI